MGFSVEYKIVKADEITGREGEVQILQCFRHPEALEYGQRISYSAWVVTHLHRVLLSDDLRHGNI